MNDDIKVQLFLDYRTGQPTTIHQGISTSGLRAACSAINERRTRGIQAISRQFAPGKQVSVNVWTTALERNAREWHVPLVPISVLGIQIDQEGFLYSNILKRLGTGAEATAWLDTAAQCVYKTFDLRSSGSLGKKLVLVYGNDMECRHLTEEATLDDTLEKLSVLHNAGACHTEIVGLADSGDFLITKQPLCYPFQDFEEDQSLAVHAVKAVVAKGMAARGLWVFFQSGQAWCLGDLHKGNIMRDSSNQPTIIDALIGAIPPGFIQQLPLLNHTVNRAQKWLETGIYSDDHLFQGISDHEL